jgi:hypothetical protein
MEIEDIAANIAEYIIKNTQAYPVSNDIILEKLKQLVQECASGDQVNQCISCGIDMGINNPRQYCCKTYCGSSQSY